MRAKPRTTVLGAALSAGLMLTGCGDEVQEEMQENASEIVLDSLARERPLATEPVTAEGENVIAVTLDEWQIQMPETLAPGSYTFRVTNAGAVEHAFEIEGASEEWETQEVAPGANATLTVELTPGTYTVYCPVSTDHGEHDELGMRRMLLVR